MASTKWEGIEAFIHVVNLNSFSKAASQMGVSKSHISRQITQLEYRLNAQLLIRTTRKVAVTEVGQAFYLRCNDVLTNLDDAEQAVIDLQEKPRGRLRVTVAVGFGEDFIAPAAVDFMGKHPDLAVELAFTNRVVDLVSEGYDLAIRSGTLKDSSLIARRISRRKLIVCGSTEYFSRFGRPKSISALINHNCLIGTLPSWRFRENNRNYDIRIEGNWRSNNGRALTHAAIQGLGLVQLPSFYVSDAIQRGELDSVLEDYNPTDTGVWAVYPHNRHLSAKVRLFVNFLAERFADH